MILAIHLLVGQMLNVQTEYALVYLNIKAILILAVDLSVSSAMIVLVTRLVSETNASIHVLELVDKMLSVM